MSRSVAVNDVPVRRIDRVLTFMSLGLLVASIACFIASLVAVGSGMTFGDFTGLWAVVQIFPLVALPVAFLLIVALLIMTFVRRGRANRAH